MFYHLTILIFLGVVGTTVCKILTSSPFVGSRDSEKTCSSASEWLTPSLFPELIPPTIRFSNRTIPPEFKPFLTWIQYDGYRVDGNSWNKIVKATGLNLISLSEYQNRKNLNPWIGYSGFVSCFGLKQQKKSILCPTKSYQKFNDLPSVDLLTDKKLNHKISRKLSRLGFTPIIPTTFTLPKEMGGFKTEWRRNPDKVWVIKSQLKSSSYSKGMNLITHPNQIMNPAGKTVIVQKYTSDPFLFDGRKIDIKPIVLVSSILPLRAYIYYDTEIEIGSKVFTMNKTSLNDRCVHFRSPENAPCSNVQNLPTFNEFLSISFTEEQAQHLVHDIKTAVQLFLLSWIGNPEVQKNVAKDFQSNGYKVFRFGFVLDSTKKPWLIDVNARGPSSKYNQLLQEILNVVGYHLPPFLPDELQQSISHSNFNYPRHLPIYFPSWLHGHWDWNISQGIDMSEKSAGAPDWTTFLSQSDIKQLVIAENELARTVSLERILPNANMKRFLNIFDPNTSAYKYILLFDTWEKRFGNRNRSEGIKKLTQLLKKF